MVGVVAASAEIVRRPVVAVRPVGLGVGIPVHLIHAPVSQVVVELCDRPVAGKLEKGALIPHPAWVFR